MSIKFNQAEMTITRNGEVIANVARTPGRRWMATPTHLLVPAGGTIDNVASSTFTSRAKMVAAIEELSAATVAEYEEHLEEEIAAEAAAAEEARKVAYLAGCEARRIEAMNFQPGAAREDDAFAEASKRVAAVGAAIQEAMTGESFEEQIANPPAAEPKAKKERGATVLDRLMEMADSTGCDPRAVAAEEGVRWEARYDPMYYAVKKGVRTDLVRVKGLEGSGRRFVVFTASAWARYQAANAIEGAVATPWIA